MVKVAKQGISSAGTAFTVDIEVGGRDGTHSYQMACGDRAVVSHNSVSLLAGATPGVHFPSARCYIRRVRLMKDSHLVEPLREAGYKIEPCFGSEKTTVVVEFPIRLDENIRTCEEVSMWEKLELTALLQECWADNQVSVTIDFDAETEGHQIKPALDYFQYRLKSVSFLPRFKNTTAYKQCPYEPITEEQYDAAIASIKPLKFHPVKRDRAEEVELDNMCDGEKCTFGTA